MTMWSAPPGRKSSSQIGFVKPFGPHHRARCCGSVQAWKTSARGASMRRVMTSSRSGKAGIGLFLSVMLRFLGLQFVQVVVQAIEAVVPEAPVMREPVGDLAQRRRL